MLFCIGSFELSLYASLNIRQIRLTLALAAGLFGSAYVQAAEITNQPQTAELTEVTAATIEESLEQSPVVRITASRHSKDKTLTQDYLSLQDANSLPSSLSELLALQPGLALNGQPGLFQTVSIRGLGRHRVLVFLDGMRLTSERRAGVAASFIDPLLLAGVEISQGPSSTYYGSGALGGSLHLQTRDQMGNWFASGYQSHGDQWSNAVGTAGQDYSAGIALRRQNRGKSLDGSLKNNEFEQVSFNLSREFSWQDYQAKALLIGALGDDIGKDNLRYPDVRITSYPEERHWLGQFQLSGPSGWLARSYFHQQQLITSDIRPGERVNQVTNRSLDLGFSFEQPWFKGRWQGLWGSDYFVRQNVESEESELDLETHEITHFNALQDASDQQFALFASVNRELGAWLFNGGGRFNYQRQKSLQSESISDNYWTYFAGVSRPIGAFELKFNFAKGFRFANLSERLFSGTTARGQVIGNPDLNAEESSSWELALDYKSSLWQANITFFTTQVRQLIARYRLNDESQSYQNQTRGTYDGWQYQINYPLTENLFMQISGEKILGERRDMIVEEKQYLADVPPSRHSLQLNYQLDNWFGRAQMTHRLAKNKIAEGEVALQKANLMSLKAGYRWDSGWQLELAWENVLSERYFDSADDLNTLAAGREFALQLSFNP